MAPVYHLQAQYSSSSSNSNSSGPNASLSELIQRLQKQNNKLQRMYNKLGTHSDNPAFRDTIQQEIHASTIIVKQCMSIIKEQSLANSSSSSSSSVHDSHDADERERQDNNLHIIQQMTIQFERQYNTYTDI